MSTASAMPPPSQVLAPTALRASASAVSRRPAPRACVTTTPTPAPTTRNSTKSMPTTWFVSAKAAPAWSDNRAASTVPTTPTPMPNSSSSASGQISVNRRGGGVRCRVMSVVQGNGQAGPLQQEGDDSGWR